MLFREHQARLGRREYHDLNRLVEAGLQLVRRTIPTSIQIETVLAPEALPVLVDEVAFRTVFLHLAINAADATDGRGRLHVRTSHHDRLPKSVAFGTGPGADAVACLEVRDSGTGIDSSFHRAVWDPLFTTKAANQGAGLGLYLVRRFVENCAGGVSFKADPKGGSAFALWFRQSDFSESERAKPRQHVVLAGEFGPQRATLARELMRRNCRVTCVPHANESLLGSVAEFDVLVVKPGRQRTGMRRLVKAIRRQQLPIRILALAGNKELDEDLAGKVDTVVSGKWSVKAVAGFIESSSGPSEGV